MKKSIEFYTCLIEERLSRERFAHSVNTAEMCRELAFVNGYEPEKAELAGILHDICKEDDESDLKELAFSKFLEKAGIGLDPLEKEDKLWHAPAGAVYLRETLEVNDMEILSAVRFHSVGRAKMTKLEKILYLGDLVERGRDYPDVEKYRELALTDLDLGMYEAFKWAINDCLKKKYRVCRNTYEGYNYYLKKIMQRKA
ncbi:MAG: bis(5'-nucleosyl)-tetraphosphatase (symmetrical) YqeK [Oscillospiraceae bacterium]|jgi:nicotinate-nucleotide adenylyltransferase|nr:bis(5'-nucleosyl)-tetraphosphatase (symmetrical) YqeK [Oscillospiraceae bacterium]